MDKKKQAKPDKKEQELTEMTGLLKRVQADFDNYRKRSQKEKEDFARYSNEDFILRLLPTLDNFKLAADHLPAELDGNNWVEGIKHIERQLEQLLSEEGVEEINASNRPFNPETDEAIAVVKSELPEGQVVEVVSRGYKMRNKVIRPAKVKVAGKEKE